MRVVKLNDCRFAKKYFQKISITCSTNEHKIHVYIRNINKRPMGMLVKHAGLKTKTKSKTKLRSDENY